MMTHLRRLVLAVAAVTVFAQPAAAQECEYAPAIVALSDYVLDARSSLPKFPARRFGPAAAYLKVQYGDIEDPGAIFRDLVGKDVVFAKDLYYAWLIRTHGVDAALAEAGQDLFALAFESGGYSIVRALMEDAAGVTAGLAAIKAMPDITWFSSYGMIVKVVADKSDEFKAGLAKSAADAGHPMLAAGLAATQRDTQAWADATAGFSAEDLQRAWATWRFAPSMVGNLQPPRPPGVDQPADPAASQKYEQVLMVSSLQPRFDMMSIFVNQSGLIDESHPAAMAVAAAIISGRVNPKGNFEKAWLLFYRALLSNGVTAEQVRSSFGSAASMLSRVGRDKINDEIDWIVAIDSLGPYVRGEMATPPEAPPLLAGTWQEWLAAAAAVRSAGAGGDIARVTELMFEAGRVADLVALVQAQAPDQDLVSIANDMALRLDRLCESYLFHPGEAIHLPGILLFKFD